MHPKFYLQITVLVTTLCFTLPGTICTAAPRIDISKAPPERTHLTPEEIEKNKEREEKIQKELEELEKKRKQEENQNNQQEKKPGPRNAAAQPIGLI